MRGRGSHQRNDILLRHVLKVHESDHHVRHLHAGVVDVVLDIDRVTRGAQQADKCVAQNRVPQMADVRCLVGIDAGMFDQYFPADVGGAFALMILGCDAARPLHQRPGGDVALQPRIDVSSASDLQLLKAFG